MSRFRVLRCPCKTTVPHGATKSRFWRGDFLTVPLTVTLLLLAHPAAAITRHDATKDLFEESLVSKLPKAQQDMWKWVGICATPTASLFTGALIDSCHVLTSAHAFFENAGDGTGKLGVTDTQFQITFPGVGTFQSKTVAIYHDFMEKKVEDGKDVFYGKGHRKVGFDLALITLDKCVPDATGYQYNTPDIIKDEREEKWWKDNGSIKIGYGRSGNGTDGSTGPARQARIMTNAIDQFGDGKTDWANAPTTDRPGAPPERTLVYDFDEPGKNSSKLTNGATGKESPSIKWEGSPASGDSGGPMFIMKDDKPILVGITSSGSDSKSRYGNVAYDTRVQDYSKWIKDTVDKNPCPCKIPEPGTLILFLAGGIIGIPRIRRRKRTA
jgi:hypothetical protein